MDETSVLLVVAAALLFILVNVWTMGRFWQDKQRAIAGTRRIAEADLLRLAMIGGTPGAFLARRMFRHKTRKQPFSSRLITIASVQGAIVTGLAIGFLA